MELSQNSSWWDRMPKVVQVILIITVTGLFVTGLVFGAQNGGGFGCH